MIFKEERSSGAWCGKL